MESSALWNFVCEKTNVRHFNKDDGVLAVLKEVVLVHVFRSTEQHDSFSTLNNYPYFINDGPENGDIGFGLNSLFMLSLSLC